MSKAAPLTKEELVALVGVVDAERERIKQLIVDNPTKTIDNQERRVYIQKLDYLTKRLKENLDDRSVDTDYKKHDMLTEGTLKPITKVKSKLDKELQNWEVESTKDGQDSLGK